MKPIKFVDGFLKNKYLNYKRVMLINWSIVRSKCQVCTDDLIHSHPYLTKLTVIRVFFSFINSRGKSKVNHNNYVKKDNIYFAILINTI